MATSRQERLSLGDFKTQFSIEGLPPFPDLDSASELRETGESTKTDKGETAALGDDPDNDDSDTEDMTGGNDRSTDTGPTGSPQAIEDHETGDRTAGETCNPGESSAGNGKNDINDTDNASAADDAGDTDDTNDRNVAGGMKGTTAAHDSSVTNGVDDASAAADLNDSNDPNDSNDTTTPPEPTSSASSSAERSKESGSKGLRQGYLPSRAYELLPDLLAGPARRISDRRERDVFLTGALPIWAAALSNVRVRYGGSDLSPNLYSATIAPPASGKSALRYARRYGAPLS